MELKPAPISNPSAPSLITTSKRSRHKSSKYRGVSKCSKDGRWQARIRVGKIVKYLGRFCTQEEAAKAYDIGALKYHAHKAITNFDRNIYGKIDPVAAHVVEAEYAQAIEKSAKKRRKRDSQLENPQMAAMNSGPQWGTGRVSPGLNMNPLFAAQFFNWSHNQNLDFFKSPVPNHNEMVHMRSPEGVPNSGSMSPGLPTLNLPSVPQLALESVQQANPPMARRPSVPDSDAVRGLVSLSTGNDMR